MAETGKELRELGAKYIAKQTKKSDAVNRAVEAMKRAAELKKEKQ